MKGSCWLTAITALGLILVSGFWPEKFYINALTVLLVFLVSIPCIAYFLRRAKLLGAEFEFREEIHDTRQLVRKSVQQTEKAVKEGQLRIARFETFDMSSAKKLLDSDPTLALAALRIEIERTLRTAAWRLQITENEKAPLPTILGMIIKRNVLDVDQTQALQKILKMCNAAVHGAVVEKNEAEDIISLADQLNRTIAVGYSINFSLNSDYQNQGLTCEYEHCIEWMPLKEQPDEYSCPVFGHNCPGGPGHIRLCGKTLDDIPPERFGFS